MDRLAEQEKKDLMKLGMKKTTFSAAETKKLNTLWFNGVWAIGAKGAPKATAELREIARKAGLAD